MHSGFATAVAQTLLLAAAVLVVGLVAALAMHGTRPPHLHGADGTTAATTAGARRG
ncbi:hypothetical protein D3C72_2580380 [compost metagenome]